MGKYMLIYFCVLNLAVICCAQKCGQIFENKLNEQEKNIIVNKHNDLRILIANGKVPGQPRGVNLKKLKWDDKLAAEAQRVSNTCDFSHVKIQDGRWPVGQNLYTSMSTSPQGGSDWNGAIQNWFDEYKLYRFGPVGVSNNAVTGHYTQVVWANTEYVGCGYTFFEDKTSSFRYKKLYTCNYGPAGNYIGEEPYKQGSSGCENLC